MRLDESLWHKMQIKDRYRIMYTRLIMTRVYLIRHAEVEYPLDAQGRRLMYPKGTHISQEGKDQLRTFAKALKNKGVTFDNIESSDYARALESAEILSEELSGIVAPNVAFSDSYVPGYIGIPLSMQQELMDKGEDIYDNPRSSDQETKEQIVKRMIEGFNDLVRRNEGKTVAIVSHGDPIRLLMYRLQYPSGEIPSMSILSKEGYLKRGEAFCVTLDSGGKVLETELLSNLEGARGAREKY